MYVNGDLRMPYFLIGVTVRRQTPTGDGETSVLSSREMGIQDLADGSFID
jgi:hypothetical protein